MCMLPCGCFCLLKLGCYGAADGGLAAAPGPLLNDNVLAAGELCWLLVNNAR